MLIEIDFVHVITLLVTIAILVVTVVFLGLTHGNSQNVQQQLTITITSTNSTSSLNSTTLPHTTTTTTHTSSHPISSSSASSVRRARRPQGTIVDATILRRWSLLAAGIGLATIRRRTRARIFGHLGLALQREDFTVEQRLRLRSLWGRLGHSLRNGRQ